jgi:hypothetical protein
MRVTVAGLGGPIDDLVVAGDAIVSEHARHFGPQKVAMVPLAELRDFVDRANGVHGVRKARLALELLRVGVDSSPESKLRLLLDDAGLPEFRPNCRVDDALNRPVWTDWDAGGSGRASSTTASII